MGTIKLFDVSQFFGYIGIAMFSFEGNGIVINLRAAARNKRKFPNLLKAALLTIIIWYMILGSLSYATYKQETEKEDYITQNLPINAFTIVINIVLSINAITSYPL